MAAVTGPVFEERGVEYKAVKKNEVQGGGLYNEWVMKKKPKNSVIIN